MKKSKIINWMHRLFLIVVLFVFVCISTVCAEDVINVRDAWIPEAPPNARVIAGYMTIENRSSRKRTLTGATGDHFQKIELHRTELHGDIMKMVKQETLEIPSGGNVTLQPGSYHLMLIRPDSVPKEGDVVDLELQFDSGYTLSVNFIVRAATSGRIKR